MSVREHFQTNRLAATRLTPHDETDLYALLSNEEVGRTLAGTRTAEQVHAYLDAALAHWREQGFGVYALRTRETQAFVGQAGLRRCDVEGTPEVELLYTIMPPFWNQGLATEVSAELVRIALDELRLASLVSFTMTTNLASQRVMQKNGFTYERDFTRANLPHVLYRIDGTGGA